MEKSLKRIHQLKNHLNPPTGKCGASNEFCKREPTSSYEVQQSLKKSIILSEEVKIALKQNAPIVALESTVLSHGLPYPENLSLANSLEDIVRKAGCTPCTIALLDGKIHLGLTQSQLERLALARKESNSSSNGQSEELKREKIHKVSVRDLAWVLSTGASGATTVAATSYLAHLIGIRVFATGGIGGVHRDGHITMDVSADLVEMSRNPVVVVCAGAKSILDIPRTLEYLETLGVAVVGLGTNEFPAFFTRKSGVEVPLRLDSPLEIAKLMASSLELGTGRGILVGVPISEKDEADAIVVEKAIQQALTDAYEQKITGRDITPFILGRVSKLTGGASLKANIALLQQNASVAAQIAKEFSKLSNTPSYSISPLNGMDCYTGFTINPNSNTCCRSASTCCTPASNQNGDSSSTCCSPSSASTASCQSINPTYSSYSMQVSSNSKDHEPQVRIAKNYWRPVICKATGNYGCTCGSSSTFRPSISSSPSLPTSTANQAKPKQIASPSMGPVIVIGGIAVDILALPSSTSQELSNNPESAVAGLSIPGAVTMTAGGVARNVSEALTKFGVKTLLISSLGSIPNNVSSSSSSSHSNHGEQMGRGKSQPSTLSSSQPQVDSFGRFLFKDCKKKGIFTRMALSSRYRTAVYSSLSYPDGKFRGGVADMNVFESVTPSFIANHCPPLKVAKLIVFDANISVESMSYILTSAKTYNIPTFFEPTSAAKAIKLVKADNISSLTFIKPNLSELKELAAFLNPSIIPASSTVDECLMTLLNAGIKHIILTLGDKGALVAKLTGSGSLEKFEVQAELTSKMIDVNGAGDSLAAGFVFGYLSGLDLVQSTMLGAHAARLTLESSESVSPLLNPNLLYKFTPISSY